MSEIIGESYLKYASLYFFNIKYTFPKLLYANEYKVDLIDRIKKVDDKIIPVNLTKVFAEIGKIREQIAMLPKPIDTKPIFESLQTLEEYGWELEEDIQQLSKHCII